MKSESPSSDKKGPKKSYLKHRRKGRELALQALYQTSWGELSAQDALRLDWVQEKISDEARDFAVLLIKGTSENLLVIDELIKKYSSHWTFDRIPRVELAILRFSIYSLLHLKEIPPIVIINEAIEVSKVYSGEDAWRYINGMLDAIYTKELAKADPGRKEE